MTIEPHEYPMIDGRECYAKFFKIEGATHQPTIWMMEGENLKIVIRNKDKQNHSFAITGVEIKNKTVMEFGHEATYEFAAPPPGSYLYYDPVEEPVNRILGLHGALIVVPAFDTKTPNGSPIPYRAPQNTQLHSLFDALGDPDYKDFYPSEKWNPNPPKWDYRPRDLVWVTSELDSTLAQRIHDGEEVSGTVWRSSFTPDYFMINGVSGFETAGHDLLPDEKYAYAQLIEPKGYEGQPTMIRCLNAGLATHSLHIHGNDVFQLTDTDKNTDAVIVNNNIYALDVWGMPPLARKDILLPFVRPLDAPVWPPREEPFPMRYVMHCHCEMSNTAGGGNYPQGMVSHWEMVGTHDQYLERKKEGHL